MTDDRDALDELVSRYLDAEATADEIARVEADPSLRLRAEQMRAAIEAIAAPTSVPTIDLDRIRAAALAESAATAAVTDLSARRRTHERRSRVFAVAAAFVLLAVGFATVQSVSDDDDSLDTATEGTDAASDTSDDAAGDGDAGDSLELFGDDEADAASSAEMATADDDMADDMADESENDESAGEPENEESADAESDFAGGDDADDGATHRALDLIDDEIGPFATVDELLAAIDAAYASPGELAPTFDPVDGVCAAVGDLITELQDDATRSIERAIAVVDGAELEVYVAIAVEGELAVITHAIDDCTTPTVLRPGPAQP